MTFCARVCAMVPHVPGAFLCACRWVVGHASLWRTLSARWWRACVWSGVGADTRRHASFAFRGGACCFALWGGDACTFALRGGAGACIFALRSGGACCFALRGGAGACIYALRSGGACCFALWGGGACSFTFRGSAGCFSFRCVKYGLRMRAARRKTSHTACADVAGSTAPAFGAPSALGGAPAFGSTSALGGAPAFGAAPSASAFGTPSQLGGTSAFGTCAFQRTLLFLALGPRQCVSFVHRWQRCFRRRARRWCFCCPSRWWRWVCELRSSSGKQWIWGFGAGRRFCTCAVVWGASLRPVNGQWSSAGVLPQQHFAAGPTSGFPASAPWCTADGPSSQSTIEPYKKRRARG